MGPLHVTIVLYNTTGPTRCLREGTKGSNEVGGVIMVGEPAFGFVVQYVQDIEASKRFYVDVLGLKVTREHSTFVEFDTFAIATDEPMGGEAMQELYWLVGDAAEAFRLLEGKADVCLPLKQVPF